MNLSRKMFPNISALIGETTFVSHTLPEPGSSVVVFETSS